VVCILLLSGILLCNAEAKQLETVSGELEVLVADDFHLGSHHYEVFLHQDETGKTFKLDSASIGERVHRLQTGNRARVQFQFPHPLAEHNLHIRDNFGEVTEDDWIESSIIVESIEMLDEELDQEAKRDPPRGWSIATLRRLLVIIVDFEDEQVGCSAQEISQTIWGAVTIDQQTDDVGPFENIYNIFQSNSANQYQVLRNSTLNGILDVVGPVRLSRSLKNERSCGYNAWADEALKLVLDMDVQVARYNQISFVLPNSDRLHSVLCRWTGLAHVGCGYLCRSWISDCTSLGVFAHELGHNAGFAHAGSHWEMQGTPIEYGDPTEIMSNQWSAAQWRKKDFYFGPIFRARHSWLPASHILSVPSSAPPVDIGAIQSVLDYQILSQRVEGEKRSLYNPFHLDGSYFSPSTARIFQLTPFHLPNAIPGTYQALKIERTRGISNFWISFRVGNVAFPQHAIVQFQPFADSTQTTVLQTIVPYYPEQENITTNTETTLWKDFENVCALRVLRTSDSIMDLQMTWSCEWRTLLIRPSVNSPFLEPSLMVENSNTSENANNDANFEKFGPNFRVFVSSTSHPLAFTMDITNMDSDMCEPSRYELAYYKPADGLNFTCKPSASETNSIGSELHLSPGVTCSIDCTVQFLRSFVPSDPMSIVLITKKLSNAEVLRKQTISISLEKLEKCTKFEPNLKLLSEPLLRSINHESVAISVTLTNRDIGSCAPRSFELSTEQEEGWILESISGAEMPLAPGKSANLTIVMRPLAHLLPGNETDVSLNVVGESEDQKTISIAFALRLCTECLRIPPLIEMWDTGVSFYVRTTVVAPIRVTNLDSESCLPTLAWFDLVPESTGFLQHSILPKQVLLLPGQVFDWKIAVSTPDTGRGPHAQSRLSTLVQFRSDHPLLPLKNITQNTWTVPLTCKANEPSLGITCPSHVAIPFSSAPSNSATVKVECGLAWRNNDNYLCPAAKWNFTIGAISPFVLPDRSFQDGSHLLTDVKFSIEPIQRIMAGETIYGNANLLFNLTGIYSYLTDNYGNETDEHPIGNVSSVALYLNSSMEDVAGETAHFGSLSSNLVQFGRCLFESNPTIVLNETTGPYLNYSSLDAPPLEFFNDSATNETEAEAIIPMVYMPCGISKAVNWTIVNPSSLFCSKTSFSVVLDPETLAILNTYNIKYSAINILLSPNTAGDVQIKFSPQKSNVAPVAPIEVKLQVQYHVNSTFTQRTEIQKIMLNISQECEVSRAELKPVFSLNGTSIPDLHAFHMDETIKFHTILNLTNRDSAGCLDWPDIVPTLFNWSFKRSWSGFNKLLKVEYAAIDDLGQSIPDSQNAARNVLPQTWQLFNFTFGASNRLPYGVYSIEIYASTPVRPEHAVSTKVDFEVKSENPRPAWDLHAIELKGTLGVSIGYDIQWRACERPGECVCPCQYDVFVNDVLAASVNQTFFAYRYSMTQAGVETFVKVVVQDAKGRRSTQNACESTTKFSPADSAYSHLFIAIVLLGVAVFPALILLLEWLRHHDKLPLSSIDFENDDEELSLVEQDSNYENNILGGNAVELENF
jgi:hypothetical protein